MPDYLGEDQRKTKGKDEKDDDKPIKGNLLFLPIVVRNMMMSLF